MKSKKQQMKEIAMKFGARLLTKKVYNLSNKIRFLCRKGHRFEMKGSRLIYGEFCPLCNRGNYSKLNHRERSFHHYFTKQQEERVL